MGMNMCNLVMSLVPAVTNHKTQQKPINPLANCSIMHMKCCIHSQMTEQHSHFFLEGLKIEQRPLM